MAGNVRIVTVFFLEDFRIPANDVLVLTMCGNQHACFRKNPAQCFHTIHQHISRACPHEKLHPAHTASVKLLQQIRIAVCSSKIKKNSSPHFFSASANLFSNASSVVVCGLQLGISINEVTPPAAAAAVSVSISALCVSPGSRKCTWSSITPGMRNAPCASIASLHGTDGQVSPRSTSFIFSPSITTEPAKRPFVYNRCMMYQSTFHNCPFLLFFRIFFEPAVPFELNDTEYRLTKDAAVHF